MGMKIFVRVERKHNSARARRWKVERKTQDLMTYSGFLSSSLPRISLRGSMFEVSAYVIVCLSAGGGAGGGGTDRKTDTECVEVR